MESKKISFGFNKICKKPNLLPIKENTKAVTRVELIKCLEGQEIKLLVERPEEKPLTIPLKDSQRTSTALASLLKRRAVLLGEDEKVEKKDDVPIESSIFPSHGEPEDIEKRAARELLSEIQENDFSATRNNLVLPVVKPDDLALDGATEPTLDDYENIPVPDFGKAMLRGMGWTDPSSETNKKADHSLNDTPMIRPKGMGLGADKSLSKKTLLVAPEANEILEIKRNAFVRILGGKYKDRYGQIEGFDDHAGRIIVNLAIESTKEAFNEFLCQPVSRKEYTQNAKCINFSKYDEYKKNENEFGQIKLDKSDRNLKNERYSLTSKYKPDDTYISKLKHCKEEKAIKQGKDSIRNMEHDNYKYESKNKKKEEICRKADRHQIDNVYHDKKYDSSPRWHKIKSDEKYRQPEDRRNSSNCEISTKRDKQTKYSGPLYKAIVEFSDSESNSYSTKYKKKSKKSHSKKSKKSKSKYKHKSSDTESTNSAESSSDSELERAKKYKKKEKGGNYRERSRSRGR